MLHIVLMADHNMLYPCAVSIFSVLRNSQETANIHFSIVLDTVESRVTFTKYIEQLQGLFPFCYDIKVLTKEQYLCIGKLIKITGNKKYRYLASKLNFSRLYLGEIFPNLGKILYLDSDVIVQRNIRDLFTIDLEKYPLAACSDEQMAKIFLSEIDGIDLSKNSFNSGVFLTDLNYWRENSVQDQFKKWVKLHQDRKEGLFRWGTQPIMNLVFYEQYKLLDSHWNALGLGWKKGLADNFLASRYILHWNGEKKPWLKSGYYKNYWLEYDYLDHFLSKPRSFFSRIFF